MTKVVVKMEEDIPLILEAVTATPQIVEDIDAVGQITPQESFSEQTTGPTAPVPQTQAQERMKPPTLEVSAPQVVEDTVEALWAAREI